MFPILEYAFYKKSLQRDSDFDTSINNQKWKSFRVPAHKHNINANEARVICEFSSASDLDEVFFVCALTNTPAFLFIVLGIREMVAF